MGHKRRTTLSLLSSGEVHLSLPSSEEIHREESEYLHGMLKALAGKSDQATPRDIHEIERQLYREAGAYRRCLSDRAVFEEKSDLHEAQVSAWKARGHYPPIGKRFYPELEHYDEDLAHEQAEREELAIGLRGA